VEEAPEERPAIQPWRRLATDMYARRYELFTLAAPVFRQHGYRGATIRALAHACHLSPAGLYHYFGSKEELATCLLRGPRLSWDTVFIDPEIDPLVQLVEFVDIAVRNIPLYMLSLRLLEEIEGPSGDQTRVAALREGETVFARFLAAAAPQMSRADSVTLARDLMAVLVGSAFSGLDPGPEAIRNRMMGLVRSRLVPDSVDPDHFDTVTAGAV
jgi:AcrR family transcriptional regulator